MDFQLDNASVCITLGAIFLWYVAGLISSVREFLGAKEKLTLAHVSLIEEQVRKLTAETELIEVQLEKEKQG